jgi:hypothetical protein
VRKLLLASLHSIFSFSVILEAPFFFQWGRVEISQVYKPNPAGMASTSDPDRSGSAAHDGGRQLKKEDVSAPEVTPATPKKPGLLKRVWIAVGLDLPTLIVMLKGALPPIIALAMLRSKTVANKYTTLGYLFCIMSLLGFAIMPRAKFVQNIVLNIVRL